MTLDKPTLKRIAGRTLRNLAYLLLSFPLGLFYFVILFTMIVVGLALVIVWIGVPVLLATIGLWWVLARFDRNLTNRLLGAGIPPMTRPTPVGRTITRRFWNHLKSPLTWTSLIYLFFKFPFATLALGFSIAAFVWSITFLFDGLTSPVFQLVFFLGLSVITLAAAFFLINGSAAVWQLFARWALTSPETRSQQATGDSVMVTEPVAPPDGPTPISVPVAADETDDQVESSEPAASTIVDPVPAPISIPVNPQPEPVESPIATVKLPDGVESLTPRETEVLMLLADGLSNQEIADVMFVTEGTIKRHTHNIYRKLEVNNRTQAVMRANEIGLLSDG